MLNSDQRQAYLTLLLLSLALVLYISNPNQRAQFTEALSRQGLGQNVSKLFCSSDRLRLYPAILNTLMNEVIPDIDVFAAVVEHRVFAERDGGLIVNLQAGGAGLSASEF